MTTITAAVTPNAAWTRAMQRAHDQRVKPTRRTDGTFRVRSTSRPGTFHIVSVDAAGHIVDCSDCPGWANGGRQRPCKHAGATALAMLFLMGAHITPSRSDPMPVPSPSVSPGQFFRTAR